jgi:WD40 repeat protein
VLALWSSAGGKLVSATLEGITLVLSSGQATRLPDASRVFAVATSSDESLLATSGTDGEIRIWDAVRDHLLLQLPAHRLPTTALAFTHDGMAVISAGNDGRLVAWDLTRRERSAAELAEIVRCRVPLRLEGDAALPRDLDFDDPACKALALDR